jgi:hypothetical protein
VIGEWYCHAHWQEWKNPTRFTNTGLSGREWEVGSLLNQRLQGYSLKGAPIFITSVRFSGSGDDIHVSVELFGPPALPAGTVSQDWTAAMQADTIRNNLLDKYRK